MDPADIALADRLTRRRARVATIVGIFFIISQSWLFPETFERTVDTVHLAAWIIMAIGLLLLFGTGGGYGRSRTVRMLMNDESTREHRRRSTSIAFWNVVVIQFVLYALTLFTTVTTLQAIHLTLTVAIGSALISFGVSERVSHGDDRAA